MRVALNSPWLRNLWPLFHDWIGIQKLILMEGGKLENLEKTLKAQERTNNQPLLAWCRIQGLNTGPLTERGKLRHLCSPMFLPLVWHSWQHAVPSLPETWWLEYILHCWKYKKLNIILCINNVPFDWNQVKFTRISMELLDHKNSYI